MKHLALLFILFICTTAGFSQPRAVSESDSLRIEHDIESAIEAFEAMHMQGFGRSATDSLSLRFARDTLRVNYRHRMYMDIDYSTSGMIYYTHAALQEYDRLLNIYYQLLMQSLPDHDRAALRQAQRNWIAYRDSEFALRTRMQQYNDGGSIHALLSIGNDLHFVTSRVIELYQYLRTVTAYQEFMRCFEEESLCG